MLPLARNYYHFAVQIDSCWRQSDQPLAVVSRVEGRLQQPATLQTSNRAANCRFVQSHYLRSAASCHRRLYSEHPHQPPFREPDAEILSVKTRSADRENVRDRADEIANRLPKLV